MKHLLAALIAGLFCATSSCAETVITKQLSIELNAAHPAENGCTLSFLVVNGHDKPVDKAVYEAVLFDTKGQVNSLMLFDFGTLPAKRPRVRQFVVPQLACAELGQVLVNGVAECAAKDLADTACIHDLKLNSRIDVEVLG